jgi:hypothetical protein
MPRKTGRISSCFGCLHMQGKSVRGNVAAVRGKRYGLADKMGGGGWRGSFYNAPKFRTHMPQTSNHSFRNFTLRRRPVRETMMIAPRTQTGSDSK